MRVVVLVSLALGALCAPVSARATGYLVVILDDVGPDKVGAYVGDTYGASVPDYLPRTPNLDSLATVGPGSPTPGPTRCARPREPRC